MKATMGERGQITIPKEVRDRLHLRPGQQLEVSEERGRVILVKALDDAPLQRAFGSLELPGSVDDIVDEMRGPADIPSEHRPSD
jgi:AbrB family looped-hinge helix DNA binding protein